MCCIVFMQLHVYPIVQVLMHFSKHKVITSDQLGVHIHVNERLYSLYLLLPILPTADVDFSTARFPQVVTILAGQTSVQFTVIVIDELIVEKDELFQLSLIYTEGQPGVDIRTGFDKANITIKNDDGKLVC